MTDFLKFLSGTKSNADTPTVPDAIPEQEQQAAALEPPPPVHRETTEMDKTIMNQEESDPGDFASPVSCSVPKVEVGVLFFLKFPKISNCKSPKSFHHFPKTKQQK